MGPTHALAGKVAFITGSSRGIGKAIALRLAREGVRVVITGKTTEPHAKLPGTIYSALREVEDAGGQGLALQLDIRDDEAVRKAIGQAAQHFGGIDMLVNNASAIFLAGTEATPAKRFDLMHQVNVRATWMASKCAYPWLKQSGNAHVLMLSPPLNLAPHWFSGHLAYTLSKYGMSMCVLGLAEEWKEERIAVNALWPKTLIATAAIENLLGGEGMLKMCRTPDIVAEAAFEILSSDSNQCSGRFFIDEEALLMRGWKDFTSFNFSPGSKLQTDLFLEPE